MPRAKKSNAGNKSGNPGSRTPLVCIGVTGIEITSEGFVITCRKIETAPTNVTSKVGAVPAIKPA
jgi:hypothetical protein